MSGILAAPPRIVVLAGPGIVPGFGPDRLAAENDAPAFNALRRALQAPGIAPGPVHHALARLDASLPGAVLVATHDLDDLIERAGARAVGHLRGELLKARCGACRYVSDWYDDITGGESCPRCAIPGQLRADVMLPGEPLAGLELLRRAVALCRVFAVVSTGGGDPIAADLAATAGRAGADTVALAAAPPPDAAAFAERISGPLDETVPALVDRLIAAAAQE